MSATDANLTAAHAEVKAEITRTDSKTALLLAFVGAVLAGTWTLARDLPLTVPAVIVGSLGLALLVGAAGLLLWSVRPNLGCRRERFGFPLWATLAPEEIGAAVARDLAADIAGLSRLAVAKFTCLRRAVDLTLTGGALLIAAALITAGGAL
ncbi:MULTISPECIES: Pycsar system effector family protein [Streptomyces]|uniref:Pycsar system effector family protein n=1 Tax=Streptomyces TaxID=1883 RepID=UPI0003A8989C|nr:MULTISPECIES: Pycsar system effector family protein [Streptomyces]AOW88577.1 integral membrane plasmid transfer protein [Streptomyces olivaceus]MBZ6108287.1 integral membrane plasmid transfer protein [Streptomyces olivaceus]MBZ6122171.1 integral membrane plasmid transfer protein [Streptomyces olivaceus]MBZ6142992.1 integral membrane plasmid transfer protein [Streptomyces olivaceus]MBZ6156832.1 integral membrane plasmid transfer protein [Streptomyces olivaceus]